MTKETNEKSIQESIPEPDLVINSLDINGQVYPLPICISVAPKCTPLDAAVTVYGHLIIHLLAEVKKLTPQDTSIGQSND